MRQKHYYLILSCLLVISCQKITLMHWGTFNEKEQKEAEAAFDDLVIYDEEGKQVSGMYAGLTVKLVSKGFKQLNQYFDLVKEGKLLFDQTEVFVLKAEGDYIIGIVPIMYYTVPEKIRLYFLLRNQYIGLCRYCEFIYQPTVSGTILTGHDGTNPDGTFELPAEMALDASGNLYVIDQRSMHDVILRVTPMGDVSTFAGSGGEFGRLVGIGIDRVRNILYVSDATDQSVYKLDLSTPGSVMLLAGTGSPGNTDNIGSAASFTFGTQSINDFTQNIIGQGLALDADGNIYVGELYTPILYSSQVRRITPAGVVTTVPGSRVVPDPANMGNDIARPSGLTVSNTGSIYYTCGASSFFQGIKQVDAAGVFSTFSGRVSNEEFGDGTATRAYYCYPKALDYVGGDFYVADGSHGALRKVSSTGDVITLAGVGHFHTSSFCGCGGYPPLEGSYRYPLIVSPGYFETQAANIRMDQLGGIAVRSANLMYVSDYGYHCIWKITIQ